jgi:glycosyltransferase involved in cell wall biosynthesis
MTISVLMSVYNGKQYLNAAMDSILKQTYADFEFIIIDDGSTDGSLEVLRNYAGIDNRIVLIENKSNIGLPGSLNKGIKIARGKYIARQDADDISALNRLETQLKYAQENSDVDIIGSDCYIIDMDGSIVCITDDYSKITDYKSKLLNRRAIFPHGSAFIKKDILIKAGLYDTRFYYSQDGELWLRLIEKGAKIHTMDTPLYYFRSLPVLNNKKDNAQQSYNKIKQMIYAQKVDEHLVNQEIIRIKNSILANKNVKPKANYMALYWKGLANTAYFNDCQQRSIPFKYLRKALKEKSSIGDYINYIKLGLLYLLPGKKIKNLLNYQ